MNPETSSHPAVEISMGLGGQQRSKASYPDLQAALKSRADWESSRKEDSAL